MSRHVKSVKLLYAARVEEVAKNFQDQIPQLAWPEVSHHSLQIHLERTRKVVVTSNTGFICLKHYWSFLCGYSFHQSSARNEYLQNASASKVLRNYPGQRILAFFTGSFTTWKPRAMRWEKPSCESRRFSICFDSNVRALTTASSPLLRPLCDKVPGIWCPETPLETTRQTFPCNGTATVNAIPVLDESYVVSPWKSESELSNASLTKYQLTGETLEWWTHFCNMALQDICLGQPTTKEADLTLFSKATKQSSNSSSALTWKC